MSWEVALWTARGRQLQMQLWDRHLARRPLSGILLQGRQSVPTPGGVRRTALHHKISAYAPELPHTSDHEMWMRCALALEYRLHSRGPKLLLPAWWLQHEHRLPRRSHARLARSHACGRKIRGDARWCLRGVPASVVVVGNRTRPLAR